MQVFWQQLLNLGIDLNQDEFEIKHIKLLNALAAFSSLFSLSYFVIELPYYPLTRTLIICVLMNSAAFGAVLWLNYKYYFLAARLVFNLSAMVLISYHSFELGADVNAHAYFLLIIGTTFFIYPHHERNYQRAVIILASVFFIIAEIYFYQGGKGALNAPEDLLLILKLYYDLGILIFLLGFCYYIASHYEHAERLLASEKQYSDKLLHNILPKSIVKRLKKNPEIIADRYEMSTILFADIVGFTELSERTPPVKLVECLNEIFSLFDSLSEYYGLEKIKTIGDAYMVAGGLPIATKNHAQAVANLALDMRIKLDEYNHQYQQNFNIRIGIHTGCVVAGVIGIKKFVYDVWGDTVNIASRMESHGVAGEIQVSESTYQILKQAYRLESRGIIPIKGKGKMQVYLLKSRKEV